MKFIYLIDSKGNKSVTLTFVTLTWIASTAFVVMDKASLGEYAAAVTGSLLAWVGREHVKK